MTYHTFEYASCFKEYSDPVYLERSRVFCLKLTNPYTPFFDLSYCYPFLPIKSLNGLIEDLKNVHGAYQCFYGVLSPWIQIVEEKEIAEFELFFQYKDHFFTDLNQELWSTLPNTHKRLIKKSEKKVSVNLAYPNNVLDDWVQLYKNLIRRHQITGLTAFSDQTLRSFLLIPGAFVYAAYLDNQICGIAIFYPHDHLVYYHLAAYSDQGYQVSASYAIFWKAIRDFKQLGFRALHLGGVPGVYASESGLQRFKKGWATGCVRSFFCGKVLNKEQFELTRQMSGSASVTDYFPPYRKYL
ncbi:MAG: GNAT family N-acetyltransferase [Thermoplasmatales archaeon]